MVFTKAINTDQIRTLITRLGEVEFITLGVDGYDLFHTLVAGQAAGTKIDVFKINGDHQLFFFSFFFVFFSVLFFFVLIPIFF